MISKKLAKQVLDICISTGGDFAEIFAENTYSQVIRMANGKVLEAVNGNTYGVGIRILKGLEEVYGYTNDVTSKGLKKLATSLASSYNEEPLNIEYELVKTKVKKVNRIKVDPFTVPNEEKVKYLQELNDGACGVSKEIVQIITMLTMKKQNVEIFNTLGKYVKDTRFNTRIMIQVVASNGKDMQTMFESYGRHKGLELMDKINLTKFGRKVAKTAVKILHADEMVGQEMPVVIDNGFGGVILHEACVHSLEATSVARGLSVFSNMIGQKIASDVVTAIDDGTLKNSWGSLNVDDEGNPTQRNVLIENGILKSYLFDYRNQRRVNHPLTGSGRRESYKYSPTSRMNNTFIANGTSTFDEIIANTEYGLYAKSMGGGSVNPTTGEFNFAVTEGYMIRNGKICEPVRGATLIGSGKDTLLKIDMVANNLSYGQGMCGSASGSIPTDVGQPTIRVSSMTVGGRGSK